MKKSQILAAIALAFALGVVAPVAGVAQNASAYNVENGTATLSDVNNAISFVENDNDYKSYVKIQDAIRAYDIALNQGKIADLQGDGTYATDAGAIYAAMDAAEDYFGYNMQSFVDAADKTPNYKEQINIYVNGAKTSELYNAFANVLAILDNPKATDAQLVAAATKVRVIVGWTDGTTKVGLGLLTKADYDNLHPEEATLAVYRTNANPYIANGWTSYTHAKDIYNAVATAEEDLVKFDNGYNLFMPLLMDSGLLTSDAKTIIEGQTNAQPSYFRAVAETSGNFVRMAQLSALYTAVQNAKAGRVQAESGDNYSIVGKLAEAWKEATGNEQALKTVMAKMVAYTAPVTPDKPDQPSDPSEDKAIDTTLTDGNVSVFGKFHSNVVLKAVKADKEYNALKNLKNYIYDITLTRDGKPYKFEGEATVTINVPEGFDGAKSNIYYINEAGKFEKFPVTYNSEAKTLTFKTTHFSLYAIVEGEVAKADLVAPGTGILGSANGNASTTVSIVAGLATALTALGAGVVAYRNARRSSEK